MPHELKLSKKQFNALVRDVHKDMMKGAGMTDTYAPPATIPDFSGPDLHFFVEDSGMEELGVTRLRPWGPHLPSQRIKNILAPQNRALLRLRQLLFAAAMCSILALLHRAHMFYW